MPCQVSTLLYCFNAQHQVLLMLRAKQPNLGQWSPCGGKVHIDDGESPHMGAQREAREELGVQLDLADLRLTGIVTEQGPPGQTHWLMFLFEVLQPVRDLPAPHREGRFQFFSREEIQNLPLPATDREQLWPLFWSHRGGFFAVRHVCQDRQGWILEASHPSGSHVGAATH